MIVLLGGPPELDGKCMDVYPIARGFDHYGMGFKSRFEWVEKGNEHTYYYSFTEGGKDYYLYESEVQLDG